jgi:trans-aconitate methyltransferase
MATHCISVPKAYLHRWKPHQSWQVADTVRALRHCTATVTVLPPYFRSLAVYRKIAVQMQCRVAEARQFKCIETVSSEAKMFKHALGGLPNMKFLPVRSTTDFFL